ncbi:MAG: hypothetical protein HY280_01105 [Nitrospinae bacterium]|nr:hypothetical protein [Nitrospinota bacterium]
MAKKIDSLISEQEKNLSELLGHSRALLKSLKAGERGEPIKELFFKRQKALELIAALDPKLKSAVVETRSAPNPGFVSLQSKVEEILNLDEESYEIMEGEKSGVSKKISTLSKGAGAMRGYLPKMGQNAKRINIKK